MEGLLYRRKMNEPHLQIGLIPSARKLVSNHRRCCQPPALIRVQMEEHSVHERRVPVKRCMAQVTQEIFELWDQQRSQSSCEGVKLAMEGPRGRAGTSPKMKTT